MTDTLRRHPRLFLKLCAVLAVTIAIGGYAFYTMKSLMQGPVITVTAPNDGEAVEQAVITVSGTTKHIAKIALNGRPIPIDEDGAFREDVAVPLGYAILSITGEDRFGKKTEVSLTLVRTDAPSEATTASSTAAL